MKQCKTCGETKPLQQFVRDKRRSDGHGSWCKPCANDYARKYYDRDLEQSRAQKRAYVDANREALNAKAAARLRQWRVDNPELAREQSARAREHLRETNPGYHREWYEAHIETERARSREVMRVWRADNPEGERQRRRRYRENNAEVVKEREREKTYARRAQQPFSPELAQIMAALVQQPCVYCGALDNITIDHIVPLSRGGRHEANNLTSACFSCNSSKSGRLLSEWAGRHGT